MDPLRRRTGAACAVALSVLLSACATKTVEPVSVRSTTLRKVDRADLCVTEGEVRDAGGGQMEVDSPAMRAVVKGSEPEVAELHFIYRGPTSETSRLANGEVRRQVALKLRAEDSCNVVYVVWRFEPESKVVVQTKANPGKHSHRECGDQGYENVAPRASKPVPPPGAGEEHLLQAQLTGENLMVYLDRDLVWQGEIGSNVNFSGPVGLRTDNASLAFEIAALSGGSGDCGSYARGAD